MIPLRLLEFSPAILSSYLFQMEAVRIGPLIDVAGNSEGKKCMKIDVQDSICNSDELKSWSHYLLLLVGAFAR